MTFLHPIFLYLMLPVTLILFYFIMTNAKQHFAVFDEEVFNRLRHESKSLSSLARNALFLMAFIFMIIAMSQPVFKEGEIVVEAKSADILVGIDISDSMKAQDFYPNRLEFAKHKAMELVKMAPQNRIGVLAFAKHDYIVSPLSFDHSSVAFLLSKVSTTHITEKGTHLDSMLQSAIAMLEHADTKNLLIFTDGGDREDFSEEIALAKENNLRVFVIAVGTQKGSPVRSENGEFIKKDGNILISKLNTKIKELATKTGGVYIESVLGDEDIKTMIQEIESITKKSTLKEETIPQYVQLFYYPLALSLLFILLAFASLPKSLSKQLMLVLLVSLGAQESKAGLLDFQKLQKAKEAYQNKAYNESASIYEQFAMDSGEAAYNLGNSLYKEKEYERALEVFKRVAKEDSAYKAKALHNAGNAQVKLQQYEEALESYKQALAVQEDQQTRENYEAVKKFLEEQKKQDQQNQQNQDQQNKDQQNQQNQDQQNKDQQSQNQKNKDSQEQNDQSKDSQQKSDKQTSSSQEKRDKSKNQEQKESQKQEDSKQMKENQEDQASAQDKPEDPENKEAQQKSQASSSEQKEAQEKASEMRAVNTKQMSELEAKKWIKIIKQSQKGHLYRMQEAEHQEDSNEKPW